MIKAATNDINNIATGMINQIISQASKEVERVLPKILRGAIEDVCQRHHLGYSLILENNNSIK